MESAARRNLAATNAVLLLAMILLAACSSKGQAPAGKPVSDPGVERAAALIGDNWPAGQDQLATTRGDIYEANLDSQIQALEKRLATSQQVPARVSLAGLLYHRFQLLGRVADAERACTLLQQAMEQELLAPGEMLGYARILSGLHEFDTAQQVIDRAAQRGGDPAAISQARQQLISSRELPEVRALPESSQAGAGSTEAAPGSSQAAPGDYITAVQQAAKMLEQGDLYGSSQLLRMAQDLYADSSPFPLAWIHLQQGVAFLRFQQYEEARVFFAAAHERLPQYYLATEHLAETEALLGNWQRSAELYRQVSEQTNQPAFWHGLQLAESELGNAPAALEAGQLADRNYRQLLDEYPLTFADHAVGYYLDTGREQQALRLAELNFANRQDVYAHLTLAEALAANGQQQKACGHIEELRRAGLAPPEILYPDASLAGCSP
jgi:tetratricopeptide (TPR) repeat protein